jgi:hypothetical protein
MSLPTVPLAIFMFFKTFEATVIRIPRLALAWLCLVTLADPSFAQVFEGVGGRALGMGGAFVAVADDSSATWWNPGGLAAGPFFDLALGRSATDIEDGASAHRERAAWFAASVLPFGFSYYRFQITDIGPPDPTEESAAGREDRRAAVPVSSLSASQFGATFVQTLFSGVHAGTTLKYVRATGLTDLVVGSEGASSSQLLDEASDIEGGASQGAFDLDVGVLAVKGRIRLGGVVRNVLEPAFGGVKLPRQVRVGGAVDATRTGGIPLMVAVDADALRYETPFGERRVLAVGGEGWSSSHRVGIRAGGRWNTVGAQERAFTVGGSVAIRTGLYVDGYAVQGDEVGWGVVARASF